jgi:hypothetical protein
MIIQLKLLRLLPSHFRAGPSLTYYSLGTIRNLVIKSAQYSSKHAHQLHHRQPLFDAGSRPDRKRCKGAPCQFDGLLSTVFFADEPSSRRVDERFRVVLWIMVDTVDPGPDIAAGWEFLTIHGDPARIDFMEWRTAYWWRHAHTFINACPKVDARIEFGAVVDIRNRGEATTSFGCNFVVDGGVAACVEEESGQDCGGCVEA